MVKGRLSETAISELSLYQVSVSFRLSDGFPYVMGNAVQVMNLFIDSFLQNSVAAQRFGGKGNRRCTKDN